MKQLLFNTCIFLLLMGVNLLAQTFPDTLSRQFQSVLDINLGPLDCPGISAAVIMPDDGVWQGVAGLSGPNSEIAMDPDMLFWTGCIDMMFTSTVILQLAEEGKLSLTDSLYKWLPSYTNIDSTITIRQLLNHTNGLYRWHLNHDYPTTPTDWVKANPYKYWDFEEFLLKFIVNHPHSFLPVQAGTFTRRTIFFLI